MRLVVVGERQNEGADRDNSISPFRPSRCPHQPSMHAQAYIHSFNDENYKATLSVSSLWPSLHLSLLHADIRKGYVGWLRVLRTARASVGVRSTPSKSSCSTPRSFGPNQCVFSVGCFLQTSSRQFLRAELTSRLYRPNPCSVVRFVCCARHLQGGPTPVRRPGQRLMCQSSDAYAFYLDSCP